MTQEVFPPVTDDLGRLVQLMGGRRRPVVAVVSLTDEALGPARPAADLARRLDVPLTVVLLRPNSVWSGMVGPLAVPDFRDDYDLEVTVALVRALDCTGVSWRMAMIDVFAQTARVVQELDAGLVLLGAPHGWHRPVGRMRHLWRAVRLSRRISVPVGVWSVRPDVSSRG